jgi:hypothetical protein
LVVLIAALIVAGAVLAGAVLVANAIRAGREDVTRTRAASLLATFASGVGAAEGDPRAMLVWEPLARVARQTWPEEFALLERAGAGTFPFGRERLQAAHARWTTEWLAWERTHDAEYKLKAAVAEHELVAAGGAPHARAKLDAIESEKLDRYQKRYEEYVRVSKALQALLV